MALTKQKKKEILSSLESIIKKIKTLVFVNFHGLPVSETMALRRKLRQEGVGYKVAKKTLIKLALKNKFEGECPSLPGEVAIVYDGDVEGSKKDPLAPAREIYNFQKTHNKNMSILGGVFENKLIDSEAMLEIGSIPTIKVLYSKLLFLFNSPMQRLAIALSEIAKKKV